MPKELSSQALQKVIGNAHVPAAAFSSAALTEASQKTQAEISHVACGKRDAVKSTTNDVDKSTRFPASSLSKIVFTYLALKLVKEGVLDLDTPLYQYFPYERFKVKGTYPEKALAVTARHVLSHTTGLPNVVPDQTATLEFQADVALGQKYVYSGEAIYYLQKVIEDLKGENLEALAQRYIFDEKALGMTNSTFVTEPKTDPDLVKVHTELGKPSDTYTGEPRINAAGSMLTTAEDFSKFIAAWLELMTDPLFKSAFEPSEKITADKCGLGWHLTKNKEGDTIAYQYGENIDTRSLVVINVTKQKGAAFFTNAIHGSSIAKQLLSNPDFADLGNLETLFEQLNYTQSDEPGWKETLEGKIAEDKNELEEAQRCFEEAISKAPNDPSKQLRLNWFLQSHKNSHSSQQFNLALSSFEGKYTNPYGDQISISATKDGLIYDDGWGNKIKLVRISEDDFLPEKDQSFKLNLHGNKMSISYVHGGPDKTLFKPPSFDSVASAQKAKGVPGVSICSFDSKGKHAYSEGKTHCNFRYYPNKEFTADELSELVKPWDSPCYILTKDSLYFHDSTNTTPEKIPIKKVTKFGLLKLLGDKLDSNKAVSEVLPLTPKELSILQSLTIHEFRTQPIEENTVFNMASLSKPVFSYLVTKLMHLPETEKEKLNLSGFDLNTTLCSLLPELAAQDPRVSKVTIEHVIGHRTGFADCAQGDKSAPLTVFEPGKEIYYSNWGLVYLQLALEKQTGRGLEDLIQSYVFSDKGKFPQSTFKRPHFEASVFTSDQFPINPNNKMCAMAHNSLKTTPNEYAEFMKQWLYDMKEWYGGSKGLTEHLKAIGQPTTNERWANETGASSSDIYCAGGIFFHLDKQGEIDLIFHNGDMNEWRSFFFMDPRTDQGVTFTMNADNGVELTQGIAEQHMQLNIQPALDYYQNKLNFNVRDDREWEHAAKKQDIDRFMETMSSSYAQRPHQLQSDQARQQVEVPQSDQQEVFSPSHKSG